MSARVTEAMVEAGARGICLSQGADPDEMAPRALICGPKNERLPMWRYFAEQAEACLAAALSTEPGEAEGWRDISTAPKGEEVLIAYWRWRNSMSPGSVIVQSATLTEHHGVGIWSWVVSDNKHGPFPIRGWCDGDMLGWRPLPAAPLPEDTHHGR